MHTLEIKPIAYIYTDFPEKFGIPRQSGLADTVGKIVFEPEYRVEEAFRGLDEYSRIWLIWGFSELNQEKWSPTVRPPRLGGNKRMGVFATRSPYRPNALGLSCVQLQGICHEEEGIVLYVQGVDMMDGTPIYDIKPYLPHVESHPEAKGGFAKEVTEYKLAVDIPQEELYKIPEPKREGLVQILSQDPRPAYQEDKERIYGMKYAGFEVKFRAEDEKIIVCQIERE